jgi:hypothetical protein
MRYHPNLLKVFTQDELDQMIEKADYSLDKNGFVNIMLVRTTKIFVEIFVDCEAEEIGPALIGVLDSNTDEIKYPPKLSKEIFWIIYSQSNQISPYDSCVSLDL